MNFFLNTDYRNSIIPHYSTHPTHFPTALQEWVLDDAELQFLSIAWEAKKGKRKRRELQGEGQSVRYCAIDQTHPIPTQAWGLIQPPSLQRRPCTEGREVEVTPLEERRERQRENIQNTYSISYILSTTWNPVLNTYDYL